MRFEYNRFSSLLLIFFVHALVYAVLLARKSAVKESRPDKWLSIFLLLCILYISPWMLGFAGWYDNQPYRDLLFYIPFQHLYFIGPVIFFYVQSLLNPSFRFTTKTLLHLIPGILYLLYCVVIVVTDKLVLHDYYFLADGADPDFDTWYQLTGLVSMLVYLVLSLRYYQLYRKILVQVISNADDFRFKWIKHFLAAFLLMLVVRSAFFIAGEFIQLDYWSTWWYYLTFALIAYYIAITGYANSLEARVSFSLRLAYSKKVLLLRAPPMRIGVPGSGNDLASATERLGSLTSKNRHLGTRAAGNEGLSALTDSIEIDNTGSDAATELSPELQLLKEKINGLMISGKYYEDPELSLGMLAKELNSNLSVISKVINQGFGMNFNDYVNQHRIMAVIALINQGEHKRQTLLGIAYEAGFNSKATFNRAFKKVTGQTPKEYIQSPGKYQNTI